MRVSRRVNAVAARGRHEEPGNQPTWGESPPRRRGAKASRRGGGVGPVVPEPVSSPGRRTTTKGVLPLVLNGRKSLVTLIATLLAAAVGFVAMMPSGTAEAKPSIHDVQHRVDRLYHAAEQASERYNAIGVQLDQMRGDVSGLRADQARQEKRTEKARRLVADSIVQQYEGDSLSAVGQAVVASDPTDFVSQLTTMSAFNSMQAGQYSSYLTESKALSIRQTATQNQLDKVAALEKQAAEDKATVDKNLAAAKKLLGNMRAKARERMLIASRSSTTVPTGSPISAASVPASGRGAAAGRYAMGHGGQATVQ